MKRLYFLILFALFFLPFASAVDFDNVKTFSKNLTEKYGSIEIKNLFGLGSTVAKYSLNDNTDFCLSECNARGTVILNEPSPLFQDIKFKNLQGKDVVLPKTETWILKSKIVEVPVYSQVCIIGEVFNNKTQSFEKGNICSTKQIGTKFDTIFEKDYQYNGQILNSGTYVWEITGYKSPTESIDWIADAQGVSFTEWAWWQGTQPIGYWKFNEANGNASDSSGNNRTLQNINDSLTFVAGKLNNASFGYNGSTNQNYFRNISIPFLYKQSFTVAIWVNFTGTNSPASYILTYPDFGGGATRGAFAVSRTAENISINLKDEDNTDYQIGMNRTLNDSLWHRVAITRDNSTGTNSLKFYLDNQLISQANVPTTFNLSGANGGFTNNLTVGSNSAGTQNLGNTTLDDLQIYNIVWTSADVQSDWNNGAGREGDSISGVNVQSLDSPANNNVFIKTPINFSATLIADTGFDITNASLYVWNNAGSLLTTITNSTINPVKNYSNITLNNLGTAGTFSWNVRACGTNSSGYSCNFATTNRTFTYGYNITSVAYNNITYGLTTESFLLNISFDNDTFQLTDAIFYYNGTSYTGLTKIGSSSNVGFNKLIVIPNPSVLQVNNSFLWQLAFTNLSNFNIYANSSTYNQSVLGITIDNCTTNSVRLINFTLFDEDNRNALNGTIESIVNLLTPSGSNFYNFSTNITNQTLSLCITNVTDYRLSYQTKYYSNGYWSEYKYGQNITINNNTIPQLVSLYDLVNVSTNIEFEILFRDSNAIPVSDALIDIQRQYVPINQFISVETPKTDSNGKTLGHFVQSSSIYNVVVSKNGRILATFNNVIAKCQTFPCKIDLNAQTTTTSPIDFTNFGGITYYFTLDKNTRTLSFVYASVDSSSKLISLLVNKNDQYGNNTICSINQTGSSGTLTCNIPNSFGNASYYAIPYSNGQQIDPYFFNLNPPPSQTFGNTRIILVMLMYTTLSLLFISSAEVMLVGGVLGMMFATALSFIDGGASWSVIIWFTIGAAILIFKIVRRP